MTRTQILLGEEEIRVLDRESSVTGASRSELIRRAIRAKYGDGRPRRRPLSIGIAASGRIGAANAKAWIQREWDRERPPPEEPAG